MEDKGQRPSLHCTCRATKQAVTLAAVHHEQHSVHPVTLPSFNLVFVFQPDSEVKGMSQSHVTMFLVLQDPCTTPVLPGAGLGQLGDYGFLSKLNLLLTIIIVLLFLVTIIRNLSYKMTDAPNSSVEVR